ncbi:MAG: hypothetical protein ABW133_21335 [Polyangiaceae bacterium]
MHRPSASALKDRARSLVERMTERERFVYAIPRDEARAHLPQVLTEQGFQLRETEDAGRVAKWANPGDGASLVVLEREDLDVTFVQGDGGDAIPALGAILNKTGFFAQSALLESAFDIGTEDARKALLTLAHMVVAWDSDWADLFLLHLASPDPVVRHDAVTALTIATMIARDRGPAPELLAEAAQRETYPKLKETIEDAQKVVAALATS